MYQYSPNDEQTASGPARSMGLMNSHFDSPMWKSVEEVEMAVQEEGMEQPLE
jgi:hypothetical protein